MHRIILAASLTLFAFPAAAQIGSAVGQTAGGAINAQTFQNNSDSVGFNEMALNSGVVATGTTAATAALLLTKTNVIVTCAAGAGVTLPAVQRYVPITIINRSGGACLVYPSGGATVESAAGTPAASASMATNTTVIFRPISATAWNQ